MDPSATKEHPLATTGSGRLIYLHTARKRSKASLTSLGAGSDSSKPSVSYAPADATDNSSSTVTYYAGSMLPTSSEPRTAGPGNSKTSGWVVAGYSVDYALDWAVVVVLGVILAASEAGVPREVYMRKADLTHTAYPLLPNSVPAWSVPLYCLVLPAILFSLHSVVLRRPLLEGHHLVLGVWTSVLFTAALTNIIKCPVGRLRPDFNARCWPDGKVVWAKEDELGGYPLCSGPAGSVAEGRKSFPSGHSSWSASALCFITWWLLDRLRVFDGSGHTWRLLAAVMPAMAALAVGVSRYTDYWHHASDIAAGLLLGTLVSWVCYRQQRGRLADVDPISYACGIGSGANGSVGDGGAVIGNSAGGWPGPITGSGSSSRVVGGGEESGTPLLYHHHHAPAHHFDLQQPQQQQTQLPV